MKLACTGINLLLGAVPSRPAKSVTEKGSPRC
jgi:hypothetical protein